MDIKKELEMWGKDLGWSDSYIDCITKGYESILKVFGNQGHSGFSASYINGLFYKSFVLELGTQVVDELNKSGDILQNTITQNFYEIKGLMEEHFYNPGPSEWLILHRLISGEPLTPLTGEDWEWEDITKYYGKSKDCTHYQNKRCSSVFKDVFSNGIEIAYWIGEKIYSDNGGVTWYSRGGEPRKQITFPFEIPEQEPVYIYEPFEDKVSYILTDEETIKTVRENYEKQRDEDYEIFRAGEILYDNYTSVTFIPEGVNRKLKIECRDDGSKYLVCSGGIIKLTSGIIDIFKLGDFKWKLKDRKFY